MQLHLVFQCQLSVTISHHFISIYVSIYLPTYLSRESVCASNVLDVRNSLKQDNVHIFRPLIIFQQPRPEVFLSPRGHLSMSGDICGCPNLGKVCHSHLIGRGQDAAKYSKKEN